MKNLNKIKCADKSFCKLYRNLRKREGNEEIGELYTDDIIVVLKKDEKEFYCILVLTRLGIGWIYDWYVYPM